MKHPCKEEGHQRILITARIDKKQSFSDKVKAVNDLLAADKQE